MSGVIYKGTEFPYTRCFIGKKYISNLRSGTRLLEGEIKAAYNLHKNILELAHTLYRKGMKLNVRYKRALSCHVLDQYSLSKVGSMLQGAKSTIVAGPSGHNSMFSVEPLQIWRLAISRKLKECKAAYLSSQKKDTSSPLPKKYHKKFSSCIQQIMNDCNNLLVAYKNNLYVLCLQINFFYCRPRRSSVVSSL